MLGNTNLLGQILYIRVGLGLANIEEINITEIIRTFSQYCYISQYLLTYVKSQVM